MEYIHLLNTFIAAVHTSVLFMFITGTDNFTNFLIIKQTRCTDFSNLFLECNSTCFRQFLCPSSGVFHCTHSNGICHTGLLIACEQDQLSTNFFHPDPASKLSANLYDIYHCCVYSENSWWWTEELSETWRVSFQE
jgi:hypothetical protein